MRPRDALTIASNVIALQRSQWRSAAQIREHQRDGLRTTLEFALERVPHYRRLRIDRTSRDPGDWLSQFPILTKSDVQNAGRALLAEDVDEQSLFRSQTSGSSGEPTASWFDRRTWLVSKYALKLRRMLDCGLGLGTCVLIVTEADATELEHNRSARITGAGWLYGQEYVSLRSSLDDHVRTIRRLRPERRQRLLDLGLRAHPDEHQYRRRGAPAHRRE